MTDYCAVVERPDIAPPSIHRLGMPEELAPSHSQPEPFPWPRILLIQHRPDGIFLIRYDGEGAFAGDTWHRTLDEAQAQAAFEYGALLGDWIEVPSHTDDPVRFALETATRSP